MRRILGLGLAVGFCVFSHAETGLKTKTDLGVDAVACEAVSGGAFSGNYSLDYLATLSEFDGVTMPKVTTAAESRDRILRVLANKIPTLAAHLTDVLRSRGNRKDWLEPRIWLDAPHSLVELTDEDLIRRLPANCRTPGTLGPRLFQVGVVEKRDGILVYEFDPNFIEKQMSSALQESMVWFSLALRDLVSDVRMLRRINRLLHSNRIDELDAASLRTSLERMGLAVPSSYFHSVCYRTAGMKKLLLDTGRARHCTGFTPSILSSITLSLSPRADFEEADFSELGGVSLSIANAAELKTFELSRMPRYLVTNLQVSQADAYLIAFPSSLINVRTYVLNGFRGSSLPGDLLPRRENLTSFSLSGNSDLKALRGVSFRSVFAKNAPLTLSLQNNALVHISDAVLDSLGTTKNSAINLHLNPISADELARIRTRLGNRGWSVQK